MDSNKGITVGKNGDIAVGIKRQEVSEEHLLHLTGASVVASAGAFVPPKPCKCGSYAH